MMWLFLLLVCSVCPIGQAATLQGVVVEVRQWDRTIVVSHREVAGGMPAMVMDVPVKNVRELEGVTAGSIVEFELDKGVARHLRVKRATNEIEQDGKKVLVPAPKDMVAPGALIPDFALTSHRGKRIHLSQFRGSVVAIQFLYTRCPMPEVCPRLAATFARLQWRFAARTDLVLLSITLDPVYDTAEILSRYASIWRAREPGWLFLTGSEAEVRSTAARFGVVYWPEEGVLTHTSTIGIVGRTGRMEALVEGLNFTAQQLGDLIEHELGKGIKQ